MNLLPIPIPFTFGNNRPPIMTLLDDNWPPSM